MVDEGLEQEVRPADGDQLRGDFTVLEQRPQRLQGLLELLSPTKT